MAIRILVCDDEPHIARAVSMKLRRAGYDVETAADGLEGLQAARRERPALVITDLQMPRMNGLQLLKALRADPLTAAVPAVMLTAKGFELDEGALQQELGLAHIAGKPFSPRELLKLVNGLLQDAGMPLPADAAV